MVKAIRYIVLLIFSLSLLLAGLISWAIYSPAGSRWVLTQIPDWTGVDLEIGRIDGAFAGDLTLDEIQLQSQGLALQLDHLSLNSRITALLPLKLEVQQLELANLSIETRAKKEKDNKKINFSWPTLPPFMQWFQVELNNFEIKGAIWQQEDQNPVVIDLLQLSARWQSNQLSIDQLDLWTPDLQGDGSINIGLNQPRIQCDVRLKTKTPIKGWQQGTLQVDLQPETEQLAGSIAIEVESEQGEQLQLKTQLDISKEQLHFYDLALQQSSRAGLILADGYLDFGDSGILIDSQIQLQQLDFQSEAGQPLQLSGTVSVKSDLHSYHGRFDLEADGNKITDVKLSGTFAGDQGKISLSGLEGEWLSGSLHGEVYSGWESGWWLKAQLSSRNLDLQHIYAELDSNLNLQVDADFSKETDQPLFGRLDVTLNDSLLYGQPLSGEAALQLDGDNLQLDRLNIHGDGIAVTASGNPAERLSFSWQIEQLDRLLTDMGGKFGGEGWLRWQQQSLAGNFVASGEKLRFKQWQLGQLEIRGQSETPPLSWDWYFSGEQFENSAADIYIDYGEINISGSIAKHRLLAQVRHQKNHASARFEGGWDNQQWRGKLVSLSLLDDHLGRWQIEEAVALLISPQLIHVGHLNLRDESHHTIQLYGDYQLLSKNFDANISWQNLDVSRMSFLLPDWQISGQSSGEISLQQAPPENRYQGNVTFAGEIQQQQLLLQVAAAELLFDWEDDLKGSVQLDLADGGRVRGVVDSSQPADLALPELGKLQLSGNDFPLEIAQAWLPPALDIDGRFGWTLKGHWRPGEPLNLQGNAKVSDGALSWQESAGVFAEDVGSVELNWKWHTALSGTLDLQLRDHGKLESMFNLPLPAKFPLVFVKDAPLNVDLSANLHEFGLISLFSPEQIQESRGDLQLEIQLTGSHLEPILSGTYHFGEGEVFLPQLKVHFTDIEMAGDFDDTTIRITRFHLQSDEGRLNGSGKVELQNWKPWRYFLQLEGKNLLLLNRPELQVYIDPDLTVAGEGGEYRVRGNILIPKALIKAQEKTLLVTHSSDLIIVDREISLQQQQKFESDIDLQLTLGDHVLIDAVGLNARLEGGVRLQSLLTGGLVANGEIHVVKGKFSSYGVSLDIKRGNLYFVGDSITQPALDILALRTVDDIDAGVKVSGTPQQPIVQLYSEPAMDEADILAYIVLGRPIVAERSETGLLVTAAGALLSQGESVLLQEKLKGHLGLDVLDFNAGNGDIYDSVLTTGKYLNPDLYVSLGYSLFKNTNELNIRYNLTPDWEIESTIGEESGIDIYYRIEID